MKERLDKILTERGLIESRARALALVMAGQVIVDGKVITKAGTPVNSDAAITIKQNCPYVSRAGYKLEAAVDAFSINLKGKVAIDVGASTGGFTDLMLQNGAARVYAVDVGHSQLHYRLRNDPRVICLEQVNARTIDQSLIPESCDIAVFDVSFISLKLVIPPILNILKKPSEIVALIKPQFEAGKGMTKKGIIKDEDTIISVVENIKEFLYSINLIPLGVIPSPVKGAKGNQEYLIYCTFGK
jgi:23S rRNA (cytidine1920-2'-O)/16S rRNA (cytidine1409-2'-O)-methyltransferase